MKDLELYQQLLGLVAPWHVEQVALKLNERQIEVQVGCQDQVWGCPQCGERMHVHEYKERRWRHLDSCQCQTWIRCRVPLVRCPVHGEQVVTVPWAEKYSRFTRSFERLAIDLMLECSMESARALLGISWEQSDGIKQRAVQRGLARKPKAVPAQVCVDEKAVGRGHDYVTVVAQLNPDRPITVDYVAEGRSQASLDGYWQQWDQEELSAVQAVSMDMLEEFYQSTVDHVPQAEEKIVYDPFHVVQAMNQAVNQVRQTEQRQLQQAGNPILQGTRRLWLYGWEHLTDRLKERFLALWDHPLKTQRAWMLKELWRDFWRYPTREAAQAYFQQWYSRAIRSRLEPVKQVARRFKSHQGNLLTYFDKGLSNGPMEGLNNQLEGLIRKAYGYRNKERFKADVFFHFGGLDLYPTQ